MQLNLIENLLIYKQVNALITKKKKCFLVIPYQDARERACV